MFRSEGNPIRLLLVDDHQMLRLGLRTLFEEHSSVMEVVGEAGTLVEGLALARQQQPDVVLLDLRLPDGHGVEGCREIRAVCPNTRVLFLTSYVDDQAVFATVMAGAHGYLLKEVSSDTLVRSIVHVAGGGSCLDPVLAERARARINALSDPAQAPPGLSPQELRVLAHVAQGLTNKEIAVSLNLSDKTVRNYLSNVFAKLNVSRRSEAVALYLSRYTNQSVPLALSAEALPAIRP